MSAPSFSAEQVRRYDRDRFLTAIFAPASTREHLFALYAFNIEIAKIAEIVSEPLIGRMRLQWWRDALDRLFAGGDIAHQVARPLGAAIRAFDLPRDGFERLIDAREFDLDREPPRDMPALLDYAEGTGAPLLDMALRIVGAGDRDAREPARSLGTAWALTGLLRAVPFHARQRRLYLPRDKVSVADISVARLFDLKPDSGLPTVMRGVADQAATLLRQARAGFKGIPRAARSPLLLATLADVYLKDLLREAWDPFVLERSPGHPLIVARLAIGAMMGRP
jgi:phytoene synthase